MGRLRSLRGATLLDISGGNTQIAPFAKYELLTMVEEREQRDADI